MVYHALSTGYFADLKRYTKVHVVEVRSPICGSKIKNKEFQWCANGIHFDYVECEHCKNKLKRHGIVGKR